jgi:hypothetical protein
VEYLIIGGFAFGVHAQPRATKDLDLFIRSDARNRAVVLGVGGLLHTARKGL